MPKRIFSSTGYKFFLATLLGTFGYVIWNLFANHGIVGWVNWFQAYFLFSGYYYPELTFLIFLLPIFIVSFIIGFLYDYLTKQGVFTGYENSSDFAKPTPNLAVEYATTTQKDVIDIVRLRYQTQIHQLKMFGFEEFGFYREIMPWFGIPMGLWSFLGSFLILGNETVRMGPKLTVNVFFPVLFSKEHATYATVSKLGFSFFTSFLDGTCLGSSNYSGIRINDENQKLYKFSLTNPVESTWTIHQQRIDEFCANGKFQKAYFSITDFFSMHQRIDNYFWSNQKKVFDSSRYEPSTSSLKNESASTEPTSIEPTFIKATVATLIFLGIVSGMFFTFILGMDVFRYIYPACGIRKDPYSTSLSLHTLMILGCIAASWALAHFFQKSSFIINGIGTRFYENELLQDSQGVISTKWLVIFWIPLIPVRSYLATKQIIASQDREIYTLQPLKKLSWKQVRETFYKSRFKYILMVLSIIAFIVWPILKCR